MPTGMRNWLAPTMEDCELPKAAIFDLDGTLLDSVDLHALVWQEALLKFGHDVSFELVRGQIGKGGDKLIPVFLSADTNETMAKNWKSGAEIASRRSICRLSSLLGGPKPAATRARGWTSDRNCLLGQEG
jgi:phosphoglycolate phosphatase-like HAD superfamily hydrolase